MGSSRKEINMLTGSLWDRILFYALPLAATGILQQLFNAADVAVVGRCTGEQGAVAMAAVGANSPVIGLIVTLFVGISLGTNIVIAIAVGMKDRNIIHEVVHTSIVIALIGGVVMLGLGELLATRILTYLDVPDEVLPQAVLYFRIYLTGLPFILLYNFEAAIFRGIGNTQIPLIALLISGIINIILNLFFVLVLGMTVDGVAIATVIANVISSAALLYFLARDKLYSRIAHFSISIDYEIFLKIMRIGVPAGIQGAVFAIANIIIQSAINSLGTVVMAASSAAFNIEIFAYVILNSFSLACTTFVGQNGGAGNLPRCNRTIVLCLLEGTVCTALSILTILFLGRSLLSIFNTSPEVIETGYTRLLIVFSAYIFTMIYEVISGYLRGFGISLIPAILTVVGICGVRIAWIYCVFPEHRTFDTIMLAYPVSLSFTAVLLFIALLTLYPRIRKRNAEHRAASA